LTRRSSNQQAAYWYSRSRRRHRALLASTRSGSSSLARPAIDSRSIGARGVVGIPRNGNRSRMYAAIGSPAPGARAPANRSAIAATTSRLGPVRPDRLAEVETGVVEATLCVDPLGVGTDRFVDPHGVVADQQPPSALSHRVEDDGGRLRRRDGRRVAE